MRDVAVTNGRLNRTDRGAAQSAFAAAERGSLLELTTGREDLTIGSCRTCVFVVERVKHGTDELLPAICSEIYEKFPRDYGTCHQVLQALSANGGNVRTWLYNGCYKYEVYQTKEWVTPCPSHVMCAALEGLDKSKFCEQMPMEDPFASG